MNQNNTWKWLVILFVLGWSLYSLYPPTSRDLLTEFVDNASGKDTNFTAIVTRARELEKVRPTRTYGNLFEAIGTNDIKHYYPDITRNLAQNEPQPTKAILNKLQRNAAGKIKLGLDLQGGTEFVVRLQPPARDDTNQVEQSKSLIVEQAIEVLRKRVDRFGVAEPIIQPAGEDRILIQLPGLSESAIEEAKVTIGKAAFLAFRLVHPESRQLLAQGLSAPGYEKLTMRRMNKQTKQEEIETYLVKKNPEKGLIGKFVSRAYVTRDQMSNQPQIAMNFDSTGRDIFAQVTKENVGRQLAIVLDGELYSAPNINEPILGGNAVISGSFDLKEAMNLANVLQNPLEAPLEIIEQRAVDPSLGKDSIQSGIRASLIGVLSVSAFMLVYYLFSGLVANIALLVNLIILIGTMSALQTTLTVPGIAGIVLTAGMAVDANVLIYERLREELAAGKSLRGAIQAGYSKAFGTIFDSHFTTLIASIILIIMGTGPVKGFGVALTIGVAASLFTALVITRVIFDAMLKRGWLKKLTMLHLVRGTNLQFLKWAKPAFALSWALILIGIGFGVYREHSPGHKSIWGVDFSGGDALTLAYEKKIAAEDIRSALTGVGISEATIQYSVSDSRGALQVTVPFGDAEKARDALVAKFPDAKFTPRAIDKVGPIVGAQILKSAIVAALLSLFGILCYVAVRYEFSFALGAVVAILHDVLMTLGIFFLSGRQLSAPIVAAILTIIGFSINDTVVIFDRIREDLKLGIKGTFAELINRALNQTLSRTIITSGTVLLATGSLYFFGGGVINDFAFTFLVGIITGTYSSIYIASALVLWYNRGQRPKTATAAVAVENTGAVPARA
jgi:SecD/SecF fusion protein